ncbi:MAG: hypothetical protein MUO82_09955, partial [Candidatus Thermoplasmatota archaeon]|nr:hypothetical protein [Candidatus Thermoplasmatota archaeon]
MKLIRQNLKKKILVVWSCLLLLIIFLPETMNAEVIVDSTTSQRNKIANWLTYSIGTTVTID